MRKLCGAAVGALLLFAGLAQAAAIDTDHIKVSLAPEKAAFMLGEPGYVSFTVRNESAQNLGVLVGGDYQNALGRPNSFKVEVRDANGQLVPQPSAGFDMGGMTGPQKLPAGGTYVFSLFLPHWATFAHSGTYTMSCVKTLELLPADTQVEDWEKQRVRLPVTVKTSLHIVPTDSVAMGKLIKDWGEAMFNRSSDAAEVAGQRMGALQDERVVPYFVRAARNGNYSLKFRALDALAKFNSDAALEGIKIGLQVTGSDFEAESTTAEVAESLAKNIRSCAAQSLSENRHPRALDLLIGLQHDDYYGVRLTVVHKLGALQTPQARTILQEMTRDKTKIVANEAQRYLDEKPAAPVKTAPIKPTPAKPTQMKPAPAQP